MTTAAEIQNALRCLTGLPMSHAGWAGDIAWFSFGLPLQILDSRGGTRTVGEHALHISGAWAWQTDSGWVRADDSAPASSLALLGNGPPLVTDVTVGFTGDLTLAFNDGDTLYVRSEQFSEGDEVESWRFFQPGRPTPHLVATSLGIGWHEA